MISEKISHMARSLALVLLGWAILMPAAHATIDVSNAKIVLVGVNKAVPGMTMILVEDTGTNPQWTGEKQFFIDGTLGNPALAVVLTAVSLGQNVVLRAAGTAQDNGSLVIFVFLRSPD